MPPTTYLEKPTGNKDLDLLATDVMICAHELSHLLQDGKKYSRTGQRPHISFQGTEKLPRARNEDTDTFRFIYCLAEVYDSVRSKITDGNQYKTRFKKSKQPFLTIDRYVEQNEDSLSYRLSDMAEVKRILEQNKTPAKLILEDGLIYIEPISWTKHLTKVLEDNVHRAK